MQRTQMLGAGAVQLQRTIVNGEDVYVLPMTRRAGEDRDLHERLREARRTAWEVERARRSLLRLDLVLVRLPQRAMNDVAPDGEPDQREADASRAA